MNGHQHQRHALENLHADLNLLLIRHGDFLRREALARDVKSLADWVEDSMRGSPEASLYLYNQGPALLARTHERFCNSMKELQQTYDDTVEYGVLAHRLRDASIIAARALLHFDEAIGQKQAA